MEAARPGLAMSQRYADRCRHIASRATLGPASWPDQGGISTGEHARFGPKRAIAAPECRAGPQLSQARNLTPNPALTIGPPAYEGIGCPFRSWRTQRRRVGRQTRSTHIPRIPMSRRGDLTGKTAQVGDKV